MWYRRVVMPKVSLLVHMSMVAAPVVLLVCVAGNVNVAGVCVVS
jgi:hypothetical protein